MRAITRRPAQSADVPGGSTVGSGSRYGPRTMGRVVRRVALFLLVAAVVPATAGAVVERPFVPRYSTNDQGAIWVTGSTLETCPAAAASCAASQAGTATGAALSNNNFAMVPVDVDADPATFNSSSSTFTPPAGSQVLFAGLYWGGRTSSGGTAPAPNAAARGTALLQTPASGGYVPIAGTVADSSPAVGIESAYVAFADVTALVTAGGSGRYQVANVQSGTGLDRYAGWSLIVVYRDLALPLRNLTVFDGLATIKQNELPLQIGVSGFRTPLSGPVRTSVGVVAYEGDRGSAGDRFRLNGRDLSDAANPFNNVFNSSVSFQGTNTISQRIPPYVNALGFDSDRIVADGYLANGAASTAFEALTTLDQYQIQTVTFTTDLSSPRLVVTKSVTDLNGGDVEPGDVLRYAVTTRNDGDDAAVGVGVDDAVPARTTLVPDSLTGPGGTVAAGGRSVAFAAGTLAPTASTTAGFDVTVDSGVDDGFVVSNAASATGTGATAGLAVSAVSPAVTSVVRVPPVLATIEVTPETPTAGEVAIAEITFENTTGQPIEDVVVTIDVPGADVLSASVEGGGRCKVTDVVRCPLGTLDPGERATVRVRFRPFDAGELAPVVTVRGDGIPKRTRTLGPIRVKPGKTRLVIRKRAGASVAPKGDVVPYRIVVRARKRGATAHGVRVCDVPGPGMRLRSVSHGRVLGDGRGCWRIGKLAPGRHRTLKVRARITAASGVVRNAGIARAKNLRGDRARASVARVRVVPAFPRACAAGAGPLARAAC